jgi:hypothetical protein
MRGRGLVTAGVLAGALLALGAGRARAATIVIDDADPAGQGLNDPTPFSPIGGNSATTLGAARLAVFQQAAALWGAQLQSAVPIHVSAQMIALPCNANSAVLADTGATNVLRDFPSAPRAGTWYPQALANALAGTDLDPTTPDIETEFNSALGASGCLTGMTFYLGLDAHPGAQQIDMLTTALHEFAHGLGFASVTDFTTGAELLGFPDAFLDDIQELGATPTSLPAMTNTQRVSAGVSDPDLFWAGGNVQGAASTLTAGLISGHVRLYAPATFAPGSSVSHYSTAVTPNELMEPIYTGPNRNLTLTRDLLRDLGWPIPSATQSVPGLPVGGRALLLLALGAVVARGARGARRSRRPPVRRTSEQFPSSA